MYITLAYRVDNHDNVEPTTPCLCVSHNHTSAQRDDTKSLCKGLRLVTSNHQTSKLDNYIFLTGNCVVIIV